eukprot:1773671-Pyramimonas_sp.AAC.1
MTSKVLERVRPEELGGHRGDADHGGALGSHVEIPGRWQQEGKGSHSHLGASASPAHGVGYLGAYGGKASSEFSVPDVRPSSLQA